jgi:hypothetical protein
MVTVLMSEIITRRGDPVAATAQTGTWEADELASLSWHWGGDDGPYEITYGAGIWRAAVKADPSCILRAGTAASLRRQIRDHRAGTGPRPMVLRVVR